MAPRSLPYANLRGPVALALAAWDSGADLPSRLARRTLYRYRRQILDATAIDILLPREQQSEKATSALFSLEELRAREVKNVPSRIQRSLFGAG